jgi:hypothetical protein
MILLCTSLIVIASEAKQSSSLRKRLDCFVAIAPRNDDQDSIEQEMR